MSNRGLLVLKCGFSDLKLGGALNEFMYYLAVLLQALDVLAEEFELGLAHERGREVRVGQCVVHARPLLRIHLRRNVPGRPTTRQRLSGPVEGFSDGTSGTTQILFAGLRAPNPTTHPHRPNV
eukprot:1196291-Prorocentrum_minimum.AAC.1